MTAATKSVIAFAKQTAKGTPNTTPQRCLLYTQGAVGPNNIYVPADLEVGSTLPVVRQIIKAGVSGAGAVEFTPRPKSLGYLFYGLLGKDTATAGTTTEITAISHVLNIDTTNTASNTAYGANYYTVSHAPGGLWADQIQDCRISALGLSWKAASFLKGTVAFQGGLPSKAAVPAVTTLDNGPMFLTPTAVMTLPTETTFKMLAGSFVASSGIPLDEQWVVGSNTPDDFDVVSRSFSVNMVCKIVDATLYSKIMYDALGTSAWVANLFKEGQFSLKFSSDQLVGACTTTKHSVTITGHATEDNIVWTAQPIAVRAGHQVILNVTGTFIAPSDQSSPITVTVVNEDTTTAYTA
jgi:hypothetical protein